MCHPADRDCWLCTADYEPATGPGCGLLLVLGLLEAAVIWWAAWAWVFSKG